jgi:mono/diheme cytochrome c family protein
VVAPPPKPPPPYVEAALRRRKIPYWAIPVVALLPVWAFIYQWSLTPVTKAVSGPLASGQELYTNNCQSCHLPTGAGDSAGGIGFQLSGGSVLQTFPQINDQIAFVKSGSEPYIGKPYGNPNRPGGQRVGKAGMPAWGEVLTDQQINDVVCYERVVLSGQDPVPAQCTAAGAAGEASGS